MFDLQLLLQVLSALASLTSILGFPIAILVFLNEKRKERKEREYSTYHALDEKYLEYLDKCIANPELDLYIDAVERQVEWTPEQEVKRYALFEVLVALLERSYLMYADQSTSIKKLQWAGWERYIIDWCQKDNFIQLWKFLGYQFDQRFIDYVDSIIGNKLYKTDTKKLVQ